MIILSLLHFDLIILISVYFIFFNVNIDNLNDNKKIDFFRSFGAKVNNLHQSGKLPLTILFIITLYNLLFFDITPGYELYSVVPILLTFILIFVKYWNYKNYYLKNGIFITVLCLLFWDMFLSIGFFYNPENKIQYRSIPTLILDIFGLFSGFVHGLYYSPNRNNT